MPAHHCRAAAPLPSHLYCAHRSRHPDLSMLGRRQHPRQSPSDPYSYRQGGCRWEIRPAPILPPTDRPDRQRGRETPVLAGKHATEVRISNGDRIRNVVTSGSCARFDPGHQVTGLPLCSRPVRVARASWSGGVGGFRRCTHSSAHEEQGYRSYRVRLAIGGPGPQSRRVGCCYSSPEREPIGTLIPTVRFWISPQDAWQSSREPSHRACNIVCCVACRVPAFA